MAELDGVLGDELPLASLMDRYGVAQSHYTGSSGLF